MLQQKNLKKSFDSVIQGERGRKWCMLCENIEFYVNDMVHVKFNIFEKHRPFSSSLTQIKVRSTI